MARFSKNTRVRDLDTCASCGARSVVPESSIPYMDPSPGWVVLLRCTRCPWVGIEAVDEADVDRLETVAARRELADLVEELERIDAFVDALYEDLILPEDF